MKTKLLITISSVLLFMLLLFMPNTYSTLLPVFQVTEKPSVISKGTYGNTVTIDLTFGREDVEALVKDLKAPYPHFFISIEWIERSEPIVKLMQDKKIPISLLGKEGLQYTEDRSLFKKEVDRFEKAIGEKPNWFRTSDYEFPMELQKDAWKEEINLLGSSLVLGDSIPKLGKGDILTVPLHQEERIDTVQLAKYLKSQPFVTIEQNIFNLKMKTKSIPD
ncbi:MULTISPECIES: hypothetical protein [unclassified Psychrobacillus]|uniref:hypothetical protein n=1 Tax=unclassified Psychrobacillus TaxID=2636677 RepID=UPI0012B14D5A|nr:hypothetical protein GI482_17890 [Bacillus sp. N3536]